jgi:hypothetical protein
MLWKNDEIGNALIHVVWWAPYEVAKSIGALFSLSSIKGEIASLAGIPKMLQKRKDMKARITKTGAEMRKWFV